ncbi:MAG: hypothetical protein ACUVRP_05890 [Chlorobiales bacterium]
MEVQGNNIQSIGKKFWRFVEVYIFVMISTVSGSVITKDVVSAKSKAKDKTLRVGIELFMKHASAPPHAAQSPNHNFHKQTNSVISTCAVGQKALNTSHTASDCAIEKGRAIEKEHFICAARLFESCLSARMHQYVLEEHVRHRFPLNLATENLPLLI